MPTSGAPSQEANGSTNSGSSTTATFAANPSAGHTITAIVYHSAGTSSVSGCGATWTKWVTGTAELWVGVNTSGSAKIVTVSSTVSGVIAVIAADWPGVWVSDPVDQSVLLSTTNGTGSVSGYFGLTPQYGNASTFVGGWCAASTVTNATANGFTALTQKAATGGILVASYKVATPAAETAVTAVLASVAAGATSITAQSLATLSVGKVITIGTGATKEYRTITSLNQGGYYTNSPTGATYLDPTINFSNALGYPHAAGEAISIATAYSTQWTGISGTGRTLNFAGVSLKGTPSASLNLSPTAGATTTAGTGAITFVTPPSTLLEFALLNGGTLAQVGLLTPGTKGVSNGSWHDPFNDTGAGSLVVPMDHPLASSFRSGHVVECRTNGIARFRYWCDAPVRTVASPDGSAGESWTLAGRGWEAYLDRGIVYPANGIGPKRTDQITVQGYAGAILLGQIRDMQADSFLSSLAWDFSETADSWGNAWTKTFTFTLDAGRSLLDIVKQLRSLGIVVRLRMDFTLQAWEIDKAGRRLESSVVLRAGNHFSGPISDPQPLSQYRTRCIVTNGSGDYVEVIDSAAEADSVIGIRPGFFRAPDSADNATMISAGQQYLDASQLTAESISLPLIHGISTGLFDAYVHFEPGDYVALDVPGTFDRVSYRVAGVDMAQSDAGGYLPTVTLNSLPRNAFLELVKRVDGLV